MLPFFNTYHEFPAGRITVQPELASVDRKAISPPFHIIVNTSTEIYERYKKQALHFKDKVSFLWLCLSSPWYSHLSSEAYEKF